MTKPKKSISFLLFFLFVFGSSRVAFAVDSSQIKELVPIGHTTGIKMFTAGVMIVGVTPVETAQGQCNPSKDAGLLEGDIIKKINGKETQSNEKFQKVVLNSKGKELDLDIQRKEKKLNIKVKPVKSVEDDYKIGVWIRDSMAGIGTITFYDPKNNVFGALGHGICDSDTNELIPFGSGSVMESSVADVKRGQPGTPGELIGNYNLEEDYGILKANTDSGIYGTLLNGKSFENKNAFPIAKKSEVKVGPAIILSNIDGDQVCEYSIEITRVYAENANDTKNMMIKVTDSKLISKTGGIVQGMSGSPILQNGKLIGAVTHVLVNDPQKGYAIFIENMIQTAFDKMYKNAA